MIHDIAHRERAKLMFNPLNKIKKYLQNYPNQHHVRANLEVNNSHDPLTILLDYPVHPHCRPMENSFGGKFIINSIESNKNTYSNHINNISKYKQFLEKIPLQSSTSCEPVWENDMFPGLDAAFLYSLIASTKPSRYIEIGSGTSTKFARRAIDDHQLATKIISIDPAPRADIDELCHEVIRLPFEDVSYDFFSKLNGNDVFFLDGSHRTFQNSDATVFFIEHLNALPEGCYYGIHDIFLPYDYPEAWAQRFYSEQYLLASYILGGGNGDSIEFPAWYMCRNDHMWEKIQELFDWDVSNEIQRHGGAFWMRRGVK